MWGLKVTFWLLCPLHWIISLKHMQRQALPSHMIPLNRNALPSRPSAHCSPHYAIYEPQLSMSSVKFRILCWSEDYFLAYFSWTKMLIPQSKGELCYHVRCSLIDWALQYYTFCTGWYFLKETQHDDGLFHCSRKPDVTVTVVCTWLRFTERPVTVSTVASHQLSLDSNDRPFI